MPTVVGVRLRFTPKTLWFDPAGADPAEGDPVIVETERGTELGEVVETPHEVAPSDLPAALKPVVRVAGPEDRVRAEELHDKERTAMARYRELVHSHKLDMKPIDVEYLFGGDKIVFYFSSEERVDFRELVRELASEFKSRIDMRQIGVRDEARLVGGVGHCGQQLCCARLAGDFQPVSIRMAKEQDLPLNPLKISGLCGRLMCCLRYEYDAYKDFKTRAPKRNAHIDTPLGVGKVTELNTPKETVTIRLEDGNSFTLPLSAMSCSKGGECPCSVSREALEATQPQGVTMLAAAPEPAGETAPAPAARRRRRRAEADSGAEGPSAAQAATGARAEAKATAGRKPAQNKQQAGAAATAGTTTGQPDAKAAARPAGGRRRRRRRPAGSADSGGAPSA